MTGEWYFMVSAADGKDYYLEDFIPEENRTSKHPEPDLDAPAGLIKMASATAIIHGQEFLTGDEVAVSGKVYYDNSLYKMEPVSITLN